MSPILEFSSVWCKIFYFNKNLYSRIILIIVLLLFVLKSTLHNWRCFIDLLWTFLCGHQPLPPPPHLHREHHRQIQRKEKDGDAPSLVLNRRQCLPVHGARYSALPSIILNVKMEQRCISFFLKTCDNKNNATALRNVRFIVTEFLSIVCFFNRIPFHCFQIVKTSLCLSRKYAI